MKKLAFVSMVFFTTVLVACATAEDDVLTPAAIPADPILQPLSEVDLTDIEPPLYVENVNFVPHEVQYFDLINGAINFTEAELAMLAKNGFVVSDRLKWDRFIEAYAWIYWQDLPVLITTDSILHAIHQSYSDMLQDLERNILLPELDTLLTETKQQVMRDADLNNDPELAQAYADVITYLSVAECLLAYDEQRCVAVQGWVTTVVEADSIQTVALFGSERDIDFTLFQPRGHYVKAGLSNYFQTMSWLAHIDFRFVDYDMLASEPRLNREQIVAAMILQQALDKANQRTRWEGINQLFEALVGQSDNMMLPDLDQFVVDAQLQTPAAVFQVKETDILNLLTAHDYGQQRVTGQIVYRHLDNPSTEAIPRPVSFMLFGQRFSIDTYVMANLVYDRLLIDGRAVERPLPATMDVMYALGNDHALIHLQDELETYGYDGQLAALRQHVDQLDYDFWTSTIYNGWLNIIRTLSQPTISDSFPQALRTTAWADKMLHTQLASWAQLRHDNLLYVKQSFTTAQVLCEYPAGYVEPYPLFYGALQAFAERGQTMLSQVDVHSESAEQAYQNSLTYFSNVMVIAEQLQLLAEKELRLEPFTPEEEAFVKSIIKKRVDAVYGCGGPAIEEDWDGWYGNMFYGLDDNPAVIADVHTNPTNDPASVLYPPRVMHVATGPVAPVFLIVDTDESQTLYVGPAYTYFEVLEVGDQDTPAERLTDEEWRARLQEDVYPTPPAWTSTFRLPMETQPTLLPLP